MATTQPTWTFLSNHGHILVHINRNPDSKVKEIAEAVGITERSALSILSDLETGGYITIERIGRRNSYRVNTNKSFRHPMEAQQPISALLRIFSKKWVLFKAGEVERVGTPLETAVEKAQLGIKTTGNPFAIASEGSIGPDPFFGFINANIETMVFIDNELELQVHETIGRFSTSRSNC